MNTILLPTDFSENAGKAIEYALTILNNNGVRFVLVNAFNPPHPTGMLINIEDILKKESQQELDKLKLALESHYKNQEPNITATAILGELNETLEVSVKKYNGDLIVMGTKGASGIKEIFVGSNTSSAIKSSICAVLAIPEQTSMLPPKKIVLAADYEHLKDLECLTPLRDIAQVCGSSLLIVNISNQENGEVKFKPVIEKLAMDDFFKNVKHSYHFVTNDNVVAGLNDFIVENKADMLAMIPGRNNFFDNVFHKSITNKMVLHTQIPLLALRS